jgi:hypothetical protein
MVYKLADAGLLEIIKNEYGSKLERVRLTDRGWEVVASLRSPEEIRLEPLLEAARMSTNELRPLAESLPGNLNKR